MYQKAGRYKRQYVGLCEDSKKVLYAFFMCTAKPGWQERVIEIQDGGDCYFSIHFDVATQRYLHVVVNGIASLFQPLGADAVPILARQ